MKKINFLFGIHCHQPVGNFDHVFKESFELCYEPFLDVLSRHQRVRCALHYTGPLLEWIEQNRPEYFDKIRMLVDRNQVEMLTGGFYEPILSILPDQDAHDQIVYMSNYTRKYFHYAPKGMWLAERVWEPGLPSLLNNAGVEYSLLDDSHFLATGMKQNEMFGYYITENKGKTLNLFPINKNLRYLIPFKQPEDTIEYFRSIAGEDHSTAVTMGDDGEKFGVWPNTYDWVYKQGYLERLFTLLEENSSWISMITFSEYIKENPPRARIYLPTSSYEEMSEWSLPANAIPQYEHTIHEMKKCPSFDDMKPFIRGGFWRNFLSKYHESNLMHKKMLRVSKLVHTYAEKELAVKKELWRGQCNCAYWHGLFGGTYLNYLRNAIYTHLIKAETMVDAIVNKQNGSDWKGIEKYDYMCDGQEKVLISSPVLNIYIDPAHSGSCFELDYKPAFFNVANTFTRKYEAYHDKLLSMHKNEQDTADKEQPASIHDMVVSKEDGLENHLQYDAYFRHLFVDHFFAQDLTLEEFKDAKKTIDTINDYKVLRTRKSVKSAEVILSATQIIKGGNDIVIPIEITKKYKLNGENQLDVSYIITNLSENAPLINTAFASELNLTFLAGNNDQRYYLLENAVREPLNSVSTISYKPDTVNQRIRLCNEWDSITIEIIIPRTTNLWRFPLETVSQSEGGFEKTYQHSVIIPIWQLNLLPKQSQHVNISLGFSSVI